MNKKELELYIHIPFCVRKCSYCDFLSAPATEQTREAYMAALFAEIGGRAKDYSDRTVTSIFIGGGTPSLLSGEQIGQLMDRIREQFAMAQDAEITMEVNPGTANAEKLRNFYTAGINRLSIGMQSAQAEELKNLGRIHDFEGFCQVYREAVELTAALCRAFGLDPAADGVVICHQEGYRRGIASNHADVLHWFPKFGKSMNDFRAEVAREMEDTVTQAQFDDMMENWLARRAALPADEWAIPYIRAAVEAGAFADVGGEAGPEIASPKGFPTRQELAVVAAGLLNK